MVVVKNIGGEADRPKNIQQMLVNTGWLLSERFVQLGLGLLVSILVARYLGPEKYGILSYTLSIVGFLGTFTYLGLNGLVVRDIVRFPLEKDILLGTSFALKLIGSGLAFLAAVSIAFITSNFGDQEFWILVIVGMSVTAVPFEVIDFWFQSQVQSRYSVLARSSSFAIGAALKVAFVLIGASITAIAAAYSLQSILASAFLIVMYRYKGFSILKWKTQISKARQLLSQSWILVLSGLFALVNLKIDQVLLRWIHGAAEVGIYSVAITFSETWYFLASAVAMSVFPRLIGLRASHPLVYDRRLQQVYDVLFILALTVAIVMTLVAGPLVLFLYGEAYAGAAAILTIHVWAGVFMFMQQVTNSWVLMENVLLFHLINQGAGALLNVLLNLVLIPRYGGIGAAISTLISYASSAYLFLFLYKRSRYIAIKISKSYILLPRLIIYRKDIWIR